MEDFDIKDSSLASKGKRKIEWAGQQMPVLQLIKERFFKEKPLRGIVVGACLHVTSETANLLLTLKAGGAQVACCASNPLSTQDEVATALVKNFEISIFAIKGENDKIYYKHLQSVLAFRPNITLLKKWKFFGSCEETTTGVIRLRAMEKDKALKVAVIAVNDSKTKRFFDNRWVKQPRLAIFL